MPETDLIKLYSERILKLASEIPLTGRLDAPDGTSNKRSPVCGSNVTVDLCVEGGRVNAFAQDVRACALGQAAASVVGASILGCTRDQVQRGRDQLAAMLMQQGPAPEAPFDGLETLIAARDFENRHDSILLTLEATLDAMTKAEHAAVA
ncbi:MAG: iron-sulfur cluster assembly scaffold protein [Pseudomonadota bacterium]